MKQLFNGLWDYIRTNRIKFIVQLVFGLMLLTFLLGDYGIVRLVQMNIEHRQLEERESAERQRILEQQEIIRNAYHPDSVEKVARERYNFRKPDETVFIIRQ